METILLIIHCIIAGVIGFVIGTLIEKIILWYKYRKLVNKNEIKKT